VRHIRSVRIGYEWQDLVQHSCVKSSRFRAFGRVSLSAIVPCQALQLTRLACCETEEEDDAASDHCVPLEVHRPPLVSGYHFERDVSDSLEVDGLGFFLVLVEKRLRPGGIGGHVEESSEPAIRSAV